VSIFSVLVVGDEIEDQMAPFQENNMGTCRPEYLQFFDIEDESLDEYENGSTEMGYCEDGVYRFAHDIDNPSVLRPIPKVLSRGQRFYKEQYASFEQYMKDFCGYESRDEKTGRFGYWENPNKKWDGWKIRSHHTKHNVPYRTFAILNNGHWIERGQMGWWGAVRDDKGEEAWDKEFWSIIKSFDDTAKLTILECHI